MKKIITAEVIEKFKIGFNSDRRNHIIKNAIIKNGIQSVAVNNDSIVEMQDTFSIDIKTGKITSQKKTGRCWLFAGLNLFRQKVSNKFKIKDFELSQNYPMFWDKLEKSNYFLENIIKTIDEEIYSRNLMWLLAHPVVDAGQWDMFSNIIKKYGVVPKSVMPETFHSSNTGMMNRLLSLKLREYACTLRNRYKYGKDIETLNEDKEKMLEEIYHILIYFLGEPPSSFNFEYRDEDKKFIQDLNLTPGTFYKKYIDLNLDDYISIINAPTDDKPFNRTYSVQYLGNVEEGNIVLYLNVENEIMKKLALDQLKEGNTVWFGCDVGKMLNRDSGILDTDLYLYENALNISFKLNKGERLLYGESCLTHAMLFTGVNICKDKPNRWKVENSWGEKSGKDGFLVMSDAWFDEYNLQIVVEKKYLSDKMKKDYERKPVILPPWDPMGSLALMK